MRNKNSAYVYCIVIVATLLFIIPVSADVPPVASFTANLSSCEYSCWVHFDGSSTTGSPLGNWSWSFMNITPGNNTEVWWDTTSGSGPTHHFGVGNFSIRLNVSNMSNSEPPYTSNISTQVTFVNVSRNISPLPPQPEVAIIQNATTGMVTAYGEGVVVAFNGSATNNATSWDWTFQSADTLNATIYSLGSTQNLTGTFGAGNWLITLSASNEYGTGTATSNVNVSQWALPVSQVQYSTTKKVRFQCQDYLGNPIRGMSVTVIGVESSLGSLDWVPYLFGVNLNNTPILNTTMTGITGNDGSIAFIMIETEKYSLHYVCATKSIDETRYYYPKQEEYLEIFWTESLVFPTPTVPICGSPVYSYSATPNGSYMDVRSIYTDCSGNTANMTFYVKNAKTKQTLTSVNVSNPNSVDEVYPVPATQGTSYHYGITGKTVTGSQVYQDSLLTLNASQWKYNPLGAANGDTFATWMYNLIAVAFIVMFGALFGRMSLKVGVVFICCMGLFFSVLYMGWLQTSGLLVIAATILGFLVYLRFAEEESQL